MNWQDIKVAETGMKQALVKGLQQIHGVDVNLGKVAEMTLDELKAIRGVGKVAIESCIEIIDRAINGRHIKGATVREIVDQNKT